MTQPTQPTEPPKPTLVLTAALIGGTLAVAFEAYGTLTAMPAAATELGRLDLYAWAFTAFVIAQVLAIVLAGRAVDRIGPVLPLAGGVAIFTLGLLGAGLAPNMELLLVSRAVQGFGGGALNLAFMVVVAQAYGKAERAWLMSILSFCWMLPSFLGPLISAWITTRFSWHWVFLGIIPMLVLVSVLGWRPLLVLQRQPHQSRTPPNPVPIWAAFAAAIGAALLQLAGQWRDTSGIVAALIGIVVLIVGLPRLMPPAFLRFGRGLPAVMWTRGLAAGAFFAAESFLTPLLLEQFGFSLGNAGLFLALGATGWTLGSVIQAWRLLRIRRDQIVHAGAACLIAGTALMAAAVWLGWHWFVLAVGFTVLGLGMGLLVSSTSLINMQLSEPQLIGRNTSSLQVGEGLGNALITGIAGTIFASLHLQASTSLTFGPIYILCLVSGGLTLASALRIGSVRNESSGVG